MRMLLLLFCVPAFAAGPLPALRADTKAITASGLSSGGYMAVQLHVAHSARVKGAGAIAAGPYYCAQGSLWTALYSCMTPGGWTPLPDPKVLKEETEALAKAERIDPTGNLAAARVWLFNGSRDRTVYPAVVQGLREYYALHGVKAELISHKFAGHAMVTEDAGTKECAATREPYINDCDYDAAGELLKHLIGPLRNPAAKPAGRLVPFDQEPYAGEGRMGATGYLYVPKACEKGRCRVHVAFHGCRQSAGEIGERFVREAGYNRWAETNRLLVLYPQAATSWSFLAFN
ncbi:MAG: extracellular catalytic domain type 2 short-chain-length polyhydroxyalkanoate depolymerase, partial [Burkholderiales bacterium]